MQVIVLSKPLEPDQLPYVQELFDRLDSHGVAVQVSAWWQENYGALVRLPASNSLFNGYEHTDWSLIDFVITLGGDGTILRAVSQVRDSGVPIVGINLGRLGFLADIEKARIAEAVECLVNGSYKIEQRRLLELQTHQHLFGNVPVALNDFTLLKRDTQAMITVHVSIDGQHMNTYWCDGIILATPTGSTGYSLSCGGPVIFPSSGTFVITPVAPHNLNVRPLVIPDDAQISFEVEGRTDHFLCTLDARHAIIHVDQQLQVRKCSYTISLVKLPGYTFLKTIRDKMAWGEDRRNG